MILHIAIVFYYFTVFTLVLVWIHNQNGIVVSLSPIDLWEHRTILKSIVYGNRTSPKSGSNGTGSLNENQTSVFSILRLLSLIRPVELWTHPNGTSGSGHLILHFNTSGFWNVNFL